MLKKNLKVICDFWANQKPAGKSTKILEPVVQAFESVKQWLAGLVGTTWTVKIGIGKGRAACVPYVVALPPGQEPQKGLYIAICFGRAGNGFVAGTAISVSSANTNPQLEKIETVHRDNPIVDVKGSRSNTDYNDAFLNPLEVFADGIDENTLSAHIKDSVKICKEMLKDMGQVAIQEDETEKLKTPKHVEKFSEKDKNNLKLIEKLSADDLQAFMSFLTLKHLQYNEEFVRRFIAAVQAKRLIVLTGLSGSGKTQLAKAFAEWMTGKDEKRWLLIPVGADWTNNEKLLGYRDALNVGKYVRPDTGVLDLILDAQKVETGGVPYFLILDEMNLSHVERYFADFLSGMESHEAIRLHGGADELDGVPPRVKVPDNLWVIGTMNVDETTYMFSPKVLDRAQVLEFRVKAEAMKKYLDGRQVDAVKALNKFFPELAKVGAEFGYRTADEFCSFVGKAISLGSVPEDAVDAAIMQKLLPKLHGPRRQLEKPLMALWALCLKPDTQPSVETLAKCEGEIDVFPYANNCRYPVSAEKIARLYKSAKDNGFASYAEA